MDKYQFLATDESVEDSKKLADLLAKNKVQQPVWLSGTDLGQPGSWIWLSVMLPVGGVSSYVRWKDNAPNPSSCMTAELDDNNIEWSTKPCSQTACYPFENANVRWNLYRSRTSRKYFDVNMHTLRHTTILRILHGNNADLRIVPHMKQLYLREQFQPCTYRSSGEMLVVAKSKYNSSTNT
ncbi:AAEL011618-PA [Aedes aegypti]|uniref:AAEL011618-PA n=1 Tax=Aedes aegypti TaxID=7159 RepID=Q16PK1_AEDAE|nr:AAEL011618-PA [Aedes aegypti]